MPVTSRRARRVEPADVVKQSNWILTISTNKRPKNNEEAGFLCDALEDSMADFVQEIPKFFIWKTTRHGQGNWSDSMKSVEAEYSCEVGSLNANDYDAETSKMVMNKFGGRVHGHITILTKHTLSVHLDYYFIKRWFKERLEHYGVHIDGDPHFWGQGLPDLSRAFRYLSKQSPHREIIEEQIESQEAEEA